MFTLLVFVSASYAANSTVGNDPTGEVIETGEPVDEVTDVYTDPDDPGTDPDIENLDDNGYLDEGTEPEDNGIEFEDYLDDELDYLDYLDDDGFDYLEGLDYLDDELNYGEDELDFIVDDVESLDDTLYNDEIVNDYGSTDPEDPTDPEEYFDYDVFPSDFEDILPDLSTELEDGMDTSNDVDWDNQGTISGEELTDGYYLSNDEINYLLKVYGLINMNRELDQGNKNDSDSNLNIAEILYSTPTLKTIKTSNSENKDNPINTGLNSVNGLNTNSLNELNSFSESNEISQPGSDDTQDPTSIQTNNAGVTTENKGILALIIEILTSLGLISNN